MSIVATNRRFGKFAGKQDGHVPPASTLPGGVEESEQVPRSEILDLRGRVAAIDNAQAVIEFTLDGTIITANENFLSVMGYRYDDLVGRHHRIFVDPVYAQSPEYTAFWSSLS